MGFQALQQIRSKHSIDLIQTTLASGKNAQSTDAEECAERWVQRDTVERFLPSNTKGLERATEECC